MKMVCVTIAGPIFRCARAIAQVNHTNCRDRQCLKLSADAFFYRENRILGVGVNHLFLKWIHFKKITVSLDQEKIIRIECTPFGWLFDA